MARRALSFVLPLLAACSSARPKTPPPVAVLFVLDKSGSMAGDAFENLKQACVLAARELDPADYAGVLAFDTFPKWVVPLSHPDDNATFLPGMERLHADGGTDLNAALLESRQGFRTLPESPTQRRRIIVISDGATRPADFRATCVTLLHEDISVSTVCFFSPNCDVVLMSQLAQWGRGRSYFTNKPAKVPSLLAQETRRK